MSGSICRPLVKIINRVKYDTERATEIASDAYWDGNNMNRHGRNTYLYRTPNGRYFSAHYTQWQGETDEIGPLDEEEAADLYEELEVHTVEFEEAFPNLTVEEA